MLQGFLGIAFPIRKEHPAGNYVRSLGRFSETIEVSMQEQRGEI